MKLNEFKAWFEGYTESIEGAPSKKQWERIKGQVAAVDGVAVTSHSYPVYIDRYVRPYYPHWSAFGVGNISSAVGANAQCFNNRVPTVTANLLSDSCDFDSATAMYAAGSSEAQQEAA